MVDVLEEKLRLAKKLGDDYTINFSKEDPVEGVKELTNGMGADVVVEAAACESLFNAASELIKNNGKFVFYSWVTQPVKLKISRWHDDGLKFINTCMVHHACRAFLHKFKYQLLFRRFPRAMDTNVGMKGRCGYGYLKSLGIWAIYGFFNY